MWHRSFSRRHAVYVLAGLALLWSTSFGTFNFILPHVGLGLDYNAEPLLTAAYWLISAAVAFAFFPQTLRHTLMRHSSDAFGLLAVFVAALAVFYSLVTPSLRETVAIGGTLYSGGFLGATPMYLLPKLADILFQQIVIAAFILTLASYENSVRFVSLAYGAFFVVMHLFFWSVLGWSITLIFSLGALLSAVLFPYLIMRVNNGFVYSYMFHWAFYVLLTLVLRT